MYITARHIVTQLPQPASCGRDITKFDHPHEKLESLDEIEVGGAQHPFRNWLEGYRHAK